MYESLAVGGTLPRQEAKVEVFTSVNPYVYFSYFFLLFCKKVEKVIPSTFFLLARFMKKVGW
jgi:hypothetical protein